MYLFCDFGVVTLDVYFVLFVRCVCVGSFVCCVWFVAFDFGLRDLFDCLCI